MTLPCGNEEEITRLDIFPVHQLLDLAIKRRRAQFFPGKPSRQADTQLRIGFRIQYVPAFLLAAGTATFPRLCIIGVVLDGPFFHGEDICDTHWRWPSVGPPPQDSAQYPPVPSRYNRRHIRTTTWLFLY